MSEMVERVARAISGAPFPSKRSMNVAKAAIAAMREPPKDVILAGWNALGCGNGPYADLSDMYDFWPAAIDAALKETQ